MIRHKKLGVIFIDCWDQNWQWKTLAGPHKDFYLDMLETLGKYDIDSYVFHTSFLSLEYVTPDVIRYVNEYILNADSSKQQLGVHELLNNAGTERLSKQLMPLAKDYKSIFIPSMSGFIQWCQTSDISNWIVVGAHWPICTHSKPLGFNALLEYKKSRPHLRFFSIPSCTAKWLFNEESQIATICTSRDYEKDTLQWKNVGNDLYELML
jgi:hypothetical protein